MTLPDAYYRQLCEHAGIALISVDRELNIRTWNPMASKVFGASAEQMLGTPITSLVSSPNRPTVARLIQRSIERRLVTNYEFEYRDHEGNPRSLIATFSPVVDDHDESIGAFACIRDITRRIQLEAEMGQLEKMTSLGMMAGGVAHHLNNILGGVVTSIDFALSADVPALSVRTLEQTLPALGRATKLLESLLAFAEGDQRQHERCALHDLINIIADERRPTLAARHIKLVIVLGAAAKTYVPRGPMLTALENILQNAADAMAQGGSATIETHSVDGEVELTVTDTGCGMSAEQIVHVFEPFYSTKSAGGGLDNHPGLGMAVVHGLIRDMGHKVDIESTPDQGTSVRIRFDSRLSAFELPASQ